MKALLIKQQTKSAWLDKVSCSIDNRYFKNDWEKKFLLDIAERIIADRDLSLHQKIIIDRIFNSPLPENQPAASKKKKKKIKRKRYNRHWSNGELRKNYSQPDNFIPYQAATPPW